MFSDGANDGARIVKLLYTEDFNNRLVFVQSSYFLFYRWHVQTVLLALYNMKSKLLYVFLADSIFVR